MVNPILAIKWKSHQKEWLKEDVIKGCNQGGVVGDKMQDSINFIKKDYNGQEIPWGFQFKEGQEDLIECASGITKVGWIVNTTQVDLLA